MNVKKIKIFFFSLLVIMLSFSFKSKIVYAKKTIGDAGAALESTVAPTGLPKGEVATYVGIVAQWLFGMLGLAFFALTLYGGIMWFIARGEDEKIAHAKNTLITAILGLIITTSAFAIATFVTNATGFGK